VEEEGRGDWVVVPWVWQGECVVCERVREWWRGGGEREVKFQYPNVGMHWFEYSSLGRYQYRYLKSQCGPIAVSDIYFVSIVIYSPSCARGKQTHLHYEKSTATNLPLGSAADEPIKITSVSVKKQQINKSVIVNLIGDMPVAFNKAKYSPVYGPMHQCSPIPYPDVCFLKGREQFLRSSHSDPLNLSPVHTNGLRRNQPAATCNQTCKQNPQTAPTCNGAIQSTATPLCKASQRVMFSHVVNHPCRLGLRTRGN